jgi:hypothetical protein
MSATRCPTFPADPLCPVPAYEHRDKLAIPELTPLATGSHGGNARTQHTYAAHNGHTREEGCAGSFTGAPDVK